MYAGFLIIFLVKCSQNQTYRFQMNLLKCEEIKSFFIGLEKHQRSTGLFQNNLINKQSGKCALGNLVAKPRNQASIVSYQVTKQRSLKHETCFLWVVLQHYLQEKDWFFTTKLSQRVSDIMSMYFNFKLWYEESGC